MVSISAYIDPQCPLCLNDIESFDHLFSKCFQTRKVWDLAKLYKWIPLQSDTFQASNWLFSFETFNRSYNRKTLQRISFLLWSIWKMRNATIFQQDLFQPLKCLIRAKKLSAEWSIRTCMSVDEFFQGSFFTPTYKLHFIRWHLPTSGTAKLNFDGSLQGKSTAGGYIL